MLVIIVRRHNNLSIEILEVMEVAPSSTWKDLKVRGEQAERFLRRKKTERSQQSRPMVASDNSQTSQQQPQKQQKTPDPRLQKEYSFKDDEVPNIFEYLLNNGEIELPPIKDQEGAKRITDPNYCAYHRRVLHPHEICFGLKNKIQALIDSGAIKLE